MIDERFSASEFEKLGIDSSDAHALALELANEVREALHSIISTAITEIVEKLNSLGHQLKPYSPPVPGDISFRDDWIEREGKYHCKLRLAVDTVISSGYAHLHPVPV